jgi:hypothetical protein
MLAVFRVRRQHRARRDPEWYQPIRVRQTQVRRTRPDSPLILRQVLDEANAD